MQKSQTIILTSAFFAVNYPFDFYVFTVENRYRTAFRTIVGIILAPAALYPVNKLNAFIKAFAVVGVVMSAEYILYCLFQE